MQVPGPARDAFLLRLIGSPDPYGKHTDGMGGATSSTSKVVILSKSGREGCDVDYRFGQVAIDGDDIYWVEGRPAEGGRNVLMRRRADGAIDEMTPPAFNVRTRAHEYGGGSFTVTGHIVYFANFQDQALYLQPPDGPPQAFVGDPGARFADAVIDTPRSRLIAVRELHAGDASVGEPAAHLDVVGQVVALDPSVAGRVRKVNVTEGDRFVVSEVALDGYYLGKDDEFKSLIFLIVSTDV